MKNTYAYTIWQWGTDTEEQFETALREVSAVGFKWFESIGATIEIFADRIERFNELCEQYQIFPCSFYIHLTADEGDKKRIRYALPFMQKVGVRAMTIQAPYKPGVPATREELDYTVRLMEDLYPEFVDHNVFPSLHPHINTTVERPEEIAYTFDNSDPAKLGFCPDTAHIVAGKGDPVEIITKYKDRVTFTHLKDIIGTVAYAAGMQGGVEVYTTFRELGEGEINFPKIFDTLRSIGYTGFLTTELDHSRFSNQRSAEISLAYLQKHFPL